MPVWLIIVFFVVFVVVAIVVRMAVNKAAKAVENKYTEHKNKTNPPVEMKLSDRYGKTRIGDD